MLANVTAYAKKAFSVAMALLLAALLIPVAPVGRALADGASAKDFIPDAPDANGLVKSGILNNHASGDVTFEQEFSDGQIAAVLGEQGIADLVKPEVDPKNDTTLTTQAQTAAEAAAASAVSTAAQKSASSDLAGKKDNWKTDAEAAAETKATDNFKVNEVAALDKAKQEAAAKVLKDVGPDAKLVEESVKLKKNADSSFDMTVALGKAVWTAESVSSQVTAGSVTSEVGDLTWAPGTQQLAFGALSSTNEGVAKDTTAGSGTKRTLLVGAEGTTTLGVPFTYNWLITGAAYSYQYDYEYGYTPHYAFPDCTYTYSYTFTYKDKSGTEHTGQTGEVADEPIGEVPAGDRTDETGIAVAGEAGTGNFTCSYDPQNGNASGPLASTLDYELTVRNLFADKAIENRTHSLVDDGAGATSLAYHDAPRVLPAFEEDDFQTGDEAKATVIAALGTPAVSETDGFRVEYLKDSLELKVTPLKATDTAGEDVTLVWTLPDNTEITHTVHAVVKPFAIDATRFTLNDQPFRLEKDNEAAVLADANSQLVAAVQAATGEDFQGRAPLYSAAELSGYQDDGSVAKVTDLALARSADLSAEDAEAWGNYAVTDPTAVSIGAMRWVDWEDVDAEAPKAGLALTGPQGVLAKSVSLTADNADSVWVNGEPQAQWNGFGLAYGTMRVPTEESAFAPTQAFDKGDGVHAVQMYARSASAVAGAFAEKEIVEIKGMHYQLDTREPVITGDAVVSSPERSKGFGGIFFGDSTVNVQVPIVDEPGKDGNDVTASAVSGMHNVDIAYHDVENDEVVPFKSVAPDGAFYAFSIKGDRDVPRENIQVVADDAAGNRLDTDASNNKGIPSEYVRLVSDASAPAISLDWDTYDARNGRYYQTNRTMTITIEEEFFNYVIDYAKDQVICSVKKNGETVTTVSPSDFVEVRPNVWQYTLSFTVDADWDVSAPTVYDIIGRSASTAGDSFTVDKTNPTMEVSFDNNNARNGNYYNAARTATITVTEHNFSADLVAISPTASAGNGDTIGSPAIGGWSDSGDVHTATVTFPGEGVYSMTVDGMDLAQNALPGYSCPEFVVDTVKPQIDLSGVENMKGYPDAVPAQPQVTVHDTNLDEASTVAVEKVSYPVAPNDANPYSAEPAVSATDLTVSHSNPASVPENDGVYTMRVEAMDKAGNTDSKAVTWSVNRFGSTYVIGDATAKMLNEYLQGAKTQDVVVTEINPSGLDGEQTAVELTKDTSNTTLSPNDQYQLEADDSTGWHAYTYTVAKNNFSSDGAYRVLFHSQDAAGNASENTMANKNKDRSATAEVAFAVDNTPPLCGFVNLGSDTVYEEASHQAQVTLEDNLKLDRAEIKVNGKTFRSLDAAELGNGGTFDIELSESADTQQVSVTAYDAAGNKSDELVATGVMVNSDPVVLWMHNTPLFVGSIVGGIAVIALAGLGVGLLVRRRLGAKAA